MRLALSLVLLTGCAHPFQPLESPLSGPVQFSIHLKCEQALTDWRMAEAKKREAREHREWMRPWWGW